MLLENRNQSQTLYHGRRERERAGAAAGVRASEEIASVFTHSHTQICASIQAGLNQAALYHIPVDFISSLRAPPSPESSTKAASRCLTVCHSAVTAIKWDFCKQKLIESTDEGGWRAEEGGAELLSALICCCCCCCCCRTADVEIPR